MQKVLQRMFHEQGYTVTVCGDGQAGMDAFHAAKPSAVILDLVLPNIFGRDLCKAMKAEQPEIPVIVVSAISEVADKVLLLELGADDYVTKPFSPRELMARVQAALQTAAQTNGAGDLQIRRMRGRFLQDERKARGLADHAYRARVQAAEVFCGERRASIEPGRVVKRSVGV